MFSLLCFVKNQKIQSVSAEHPSKSREVGKRDSHPFTNNWWSGSIVSSRRFDVPSNIGREYASNSLDFKQ